MHRFLPDSAQTYSLHTNIASKLTPVPGGNTCLLWRTQLKTLALWVFSSGQQKPVEFSICCAKGLDFVCYRVKFTHSAATKIINGATPAVGEAPIMDDRSKPTVPDSEGDAPTVLVAQAPAQADATVLVSPKPHTPDGTATRAQSQQTAPDQTQQTLNPLTNQLHTPYANGGDVIKDRFIIEQELGQGGMGTVSRSGFAQS
jgi:hypothetical protein